MILRSLATVAALTLLASCCDGGYVAHEFEQTGWGKGRLKLVRKCDDEVKVVASRAVTLSAPGVDWKQESSTDAEGWVSFDLPEQYSNKADRLDLTLSSRFGRDEVVSVPLKKRQVVVATRCEPRVLSYYKVGLRCTDEEKWQAWPPEANEFVSMTRNHHGPLDVTVGNVQKTVTLDSGVGFIEFARSEVQPVLAEPFLAIGGPGSQSVTNLRFPAVENRVVPLIVQGSGAPASVVLESRSLDVTDVKVIAGFRNEEGEWLRGQLTQTQYFKEVIATLQPGERREVTLTYPKPLIGNYRTDLTVDVVATRPYEP